MVTGRARGSATGRGRLTTPSEEAHYDGDESGLFGMDEVDARVGLQSRVAALKKKAGGAGEGKGEGRDGGT